MVNYYVYEEKACIVSEVLLSRPVHSGFYPGKQRGKEDLWIGLWWLPWNCLNAVIDCYRSVNLCTSVHQAGRAVADNSHLRHKLFDRLFFPPACSFNHQSHWPSLTNPPETPIIYIIYNCLFAVSCTTLTLTNNFPAHNLISFSHGVYICMYLYLLYSVFFHFCMQTLPFLYFWY